MPTEFKRGTIREKDGRLYWHTENRKRPDGSIKATQVWLTVEAFERKKAKTKRAAHKIYAQNRLIPECRAKACEASKITNKHAWDTRPKVMMVQRVKARCKKTNLPFDLGANDFEIPLVCPLLGIPLVRGNNSTSANSPSLDRKIPSLGYVKGNVWVISWRANAIKRDATIQELELLVTNLRRHINGHPI